MKREDLVSFVKKFNKVKVVPTNTITKCLAELNDSEKELFLHLVDFKNGSLFKKKLEEGEI